MIRLSSFAARALAALGQCYRVRTSRQRRGRSRRTRFVTRRGTASSAARDSAQQAADLPAGGADAQSRLAKSPRHGEWVMVKVGSDSVRAWVVYPQVSTKAPVVVVVHEIFGLSNWIRGVADQLAADGFIAIAPDLLTGKIAPNLDDSTLKAQGPALIQHARSRDRAARSRCGRAIRDGAARGREEIRHRRLLLGRRRLVRARRARGHLPAARRVPSCTTVCRPKPDQLPNVHAPVLGLYGGTDARIALTVPGTDSALKALGRTYEHTIFAGAAHGFLRAQTQTDGSIMQANADATKSGVAGDDRVVQEIFEVATPASSAARHGVCA